MEEKSLIIVNHLNIDGIAKKMQESGWKYITDDETKKETTAYERFS